MKFEDLSIDQRILNVLNEKGMSTPTEIQKLVIRAIIAGRDVLAIAQIGTGKTAAFLIPVLERLLPDTTHGAVKTLILVPTRELAQQVGSVWSELAKNSSMSHALIYGGVPIEEQIERLQQGVDVVIATPGRLVDLIKREEIDLSAVKMLVLDEADRMLDMGFSDDITFITKQIGRAHV